MWKRSSTRYEGSRVGRGSSPAEFPPHKNKPLYMFMCVYGEGENCLIFFHPGFVAQMSASRERWEYATLVDARVLCAKNSPFHNFAIVGGTSRYRSFPVSGWSFDSRRNRVESPSKSSSSLVSRRYPIKHPVKHLEPFPAREHVRSSSSLLFSPFLSRRDDHCNEKKSHHIKSDHITLCRMFFFHTATNKMTESWLKRTAPIHTQYTL